MYHCDSDVPRPQATPGLHPGRSSAKTASGVAAMEVARQANGFETGLMLFLLAGSVTLGAG